MEPGTDQWAEILTLILSLKVKTGGMNTAVNVVGKALADVRRLLPMEDPATVLARNPALVLDMDQLGQKSSIEIGIEDLNDDGSQLK